jgi:antitoxin MazE
LTCAKSPDASIEPAQRKECDLTELVEGITRENLHDEADFGKPVGKEAL